jgi:hypothetical protein
MECWKSSVHRNATITKKPAIAQGLTPYFIVQSESRSKVMGFMNAS